MDSLTQLVLGAGVGAAVLGKPLGPRRAAVLGGILGTLPDLDVFFPFDDPVESFVLHRGATHSLIVHAVVTPLIAEPLVRFVKPLKGERLRVYAAVFLCFATHALLDAMTIYGTRLFWPVWPEPLGAGSIFIIDPLYTLPLLVAFVWALCEGLDPALSHRAGNLLAAVQRLSGLDAGGTADRDGTGRRSPGAGGDCPRARAGNPLALQHRGLAGDRLGRSALSQPLSADHGAGRSAGDPLPPQWREPGRLSEQNRGGGNPGRLHERNLQPGTLARHAGG